MRYGFLLIYVCDCTDQEISFFCGLKSNPNSQEASLQKLIQSCRLWWSQNPNLLNFAYFSFNLAISLHLFSIQLLILHIVYRNWIAFEICTFLSNLVGPTWNVKCHQREQTETEGMASPAMCAITENFIK